MQQLEKFRRDVDQFMRDHPQSPLEHEQRHEFDGLNYYPPNPDLIIETEVERLPDDEPVIEMQTSTGSTQPFRRWGQFSFNVDGDETALTLYSDPQGRDFFLPFKDTTNGQETYGAGRYMDDHRPAIVRLDNNRFRFDFNYAYNPYCAYSAMYSCPLPPRENWLEVPIRAGEKAFESDHAY
ncbi:MAG: DUF1684 domain-containing protein [Candidatus Promineifilaceae bacterium]|nr:DUF1684 domain-containing protein [Candidatus Promineifilaceae bacterium]